MGLIRAFQESLHVEFATGEIPGFVHLYAGEEAIATAICLLLDDRDKITSTHRGHGRCLAKGCDVYGMMAEIYGRKNGLCAGKGGSMHIADLSKGMLGANGIVAAAHRSPVGQPWRLRRWARVALRSALWVTAARIKVRSWKASTWLLLWSLPLRVCH